MKTYTIHENACGQVLNESSAVGFRVVDAAGGAIELVVRNGNVLIVGNGWGITADLLCDLVRSQFNQPRQDALSTAHDRTSDGRVEFLLNHVPDAHFRNWKVLRKTDEQGGDLVMRAEYDGRAFTIAGRDMCRFYKQPYNEASLQQIADWLNGPAQLSPEFPNDDQ